MIRTLIVSQQFEAFEQALRFLPLGVWQVVVVCLQDLVQVQLVLQVRRRVRWQCLLRQPLCHTVRAFLF